MAGLFRSARRPWELSLLQETAFRTGRAQGPKLPGHQQAYRLTRSATGPALAPQDGLGRWRHSRRSRRLAPAPTEEAAMAHELGPGRKLAHHRGSFLEGPAGSTRARQEGLSGGMHDELDVQHAARQAHGRARLSFSAVGRAFTHLARRGRSKARARASGVSFGRAPAEVAAASAAEPAPRRRLRARRSSPLRGPITRPYLRSGLSARRLHSTCFPVRAPAPGARAHRRQAARRARPQAPAHSSGAPRRSAASRAACGRLRK